MKFGKLTKKAKRKGVEQEDFWEDVKFDNADAKKLATQDFKPWKNNLEGNCISCRSTTFRFILSRNT